MFNLFKRNKKHGSERATNIVVGSRANSGVTECYNRLKDNLLYINDDNNIKVIQVESAVSGEGKTTLMCKLAESIAMNEKKVCVVDLDFRKPRIHRTFNIENENGMAEYLVGKITKDELIKKTDYNVDVINRGGKISNASMALTSTKFINLLKELRQEYDFVLLDAPPVLQISDYVHISRVSDGIIFVSAAGFTRRNQVRDAFYEMRKNNIKVIGTVMTFVKRKGAYSKYYYNYYGHKYYYNNYYNYSYYDKEDKEDKEEQANSTDAEEVKSESEN